MILKLINLFLGLFGYEICSELILKDKYYPKVSGINLDKSRFHYDYFNGQFNVFTDYKDIRIVIKSFSIEEYAYGSVDYARECAKDLVDNLNSRM